MDDGFKGRILLVDDDASVCIFYEKILARAGFHIDLAYNLGEMRTRLNAVTYDFVLLDLSLGSEHGLDGLAMVLKDAPFTKVFILTANGTVQGAVEAMQRGATGFFEKGGDVQKLVAEFVTRAKETPESDDVDLKSLGLIGQSPGLMEVVDKVLRLKDVDSMILLLGESGTGKEVIARAIHHTSKRGKNRFDAINCGAIPEALLESELFGHTRGAFTDAKTSRKGIFEICSSGTLLLDEIGDMPLSLQMKLLRVLQEHEITPVGASASIKVDTRVIAATHRDILVEARAKRFREDLYYRLSIVVLHIPPLRQRIEDIPLLVAHFLEIFNRRFGREVRAPSASLMHKMMSYDWPGNIRELQNALERSVVLSINGKINDEDMFAHLSFGTPEMPKAAAFSDVPILADESAAFGLPLTEAKQAFERRYLEHHLKECNGHVVAVAEKSGRYRADVYRLLSRYGIDHADFRV
jgi:DNA-binding NtrC family response regulator